MAERKKLTLLLHEPSILGDICKINGLFTLFPHLPPSLFCKRTLNLDLIRWLFWDISRPSVFIPIPKIGMYLISQIYWPVMWSVEQAWTQTCNRINYNVVLNLRKKKKKIVRLILGMFYIVLFSSWFFFFFFVLIFTFKFRIALFSKWKHRAKLNFNMNSKEKNLVYILYVVFEFWMNYNMKYT